MNLEERKNQKIDLIEQFYKTYERLPKQKEFVIGTFLNSVQQENTKLTKEQMDRLTKLGFQNPYLSKKRQELLVQLHKAKRNLIASIEEKEFVRNR